MKEVNITKITIPQDKTGAIIIIIIIIIIMLGMVLIKILWAP